MTARATLGGLPVTRKGEGRPPREPSVRMRNSTEGRRVAATLPTETYVRFKAFVARRGGTAEQVIVAAITALLRED